MFNTVNRKCMKTMIYETCFNENGDLDIKGLKQVYSNRSPRCITGAVGILYQPYNGEDDADVYGLYLSHRDLPDEVGNVNMRFTPLFDCDGNHILLRGEHLIEIPFAVLQSNYDRELETWFTKIKFEHS